MYIVRTLCTYLYVPFACCGECIIAVMYVDLFLMDPYVRYSRGCFLLELETLMPLDLCPCEKVNPACCKFYLVPNFDH